MSTKFVPLALGREQRANKGNRLQKVLNDELEDEEVYKELYGGFAEASDDEQYETEEDEDDIVDSDFDEADENENDEDHKDDENDDDDAPRKRPRLLPGDTKPSRKKFPPPKQTQTKSAKTLGRPKKARAKDKTEPSAAPTVLAASVPAPMAGVSTESSSSLGAPSPSSAGPRRKSTRSTVIEHTEEVNRRIQEREERRVRSYSGRGKREPVIKMTQEELLAEAKQTEAINLATLDQYLKMEEEKKKSKASTTVLTGPRYIYHSMTIVDPATHERQCRNLVSFVDVVDISKALTGAS